MTKIKIEHKDTEGNTATLYDGPHDNPDISSIITAAIKEHPTGMLSLRRYVEGTSKPNPAWIDYPREPGESEPDKSAAAIILGEGNDGALKGNIKL